ncbi:YgiT-type zinc finger protein [Brevibacillus sp. NPDC058079]|uniref:YgiT-type zinc finger protein n=1 Tax=Brevibacillus sp. NPDC058079 TaxID=3346330 RepID=UPI0036E408ED
MLVTEERPPQKMDVACMCGSHATYHVGTVEHFVGAKRILVHNVPHYHCSNCGKKKYDIKTNVSAVLKYAYTNNMRDVDWDNRGLYV